MGNVSGGEGSADDATRKKRALLHALNAFNRRQTARVSITLRKEDDDDTPTDDREDSSDVGEDAADVSSGSQLQRPQMVDVGILDRLDMVRYRNDDVDDEENDDRGSEVLDHEDNKTVKSEESVKNDRKQSASKVWHSF